MTVLVKCILCLLLAYSVLDYFHLNRMSEVVVIIMAAMSGMAIALVITETFWGGVGFSCQVYP